MDLISYDNFTEQRKKFEKSIKKELSKYLIKKAVKDGLLNEKTGDLIIKNIQ